LTPGHGQVAHATWIEDRFAPDHGQVAHATWIEDRFAPDHGQVAHATGGWMCGHSASLYRGVGLRWLVLRCAADLGKRGFWRVDVDLIFIFGDWGGAGPVLECAAACSCQMDRRTFVSQTDKLTMP
jgi:hypothetical protein